jgi:hypothetical protein
MSRSSVASIALVAAAVAGAVMWYCKSGAGRARHEGEVTRWEGEGGNVPDVAVETGNQGGGPAGKPAIEKSSPSVSKSEKSAPADKSGPSETQADEPWPFPRS